MTATLPSTPDCVNSPSPITATAACYATNIIPRSACSTRTPSNNSWSLLNLARNRHHHHWRFPHRRRHQPRYEQGLHRLSPKPHPPTHRRYPRLPRPVHASHSASGQKRNQIRLFLRNLAKHDRKRRLPLRTSTHPGDAYRSLSIHGVRIRPKCVTISKRANSLQPVPPQPVAQGGVRGALFTLSSEGRPLNFLPAARRLLNSFPSANLRHLRASLP
jgi:hypothetical protein